MKLRVARHTNDLEKIKSFYIDILGFELLGSFENHDNYNGIFIGKSNLDWHFEFTQSNNTANHSFDEDDIFVFYPNTLVEFNNLIKKILDNNTPAIKAKNPYWNNPEVSISKMFMDPDGYRIIISNLKVK
jgi:catechol 2,3-dioxygenase-like lactoylglutathione lyase family enzyme